MNSGYERARRLPPSLGKRGSSTLVRQRTSGQTRHVESTNTNKETSMTTSLKSTTIALFALPIADAFAGRNWG